MKIIYGITKSAPFGGAQRYVFDLACEAKRRGHDVAVLCGGQGALVDKLRAEDIRVISLPSLKRDISLLSEIPVGIEVMNILCQEQPDIFHINSSKMGGTGSFAARLVNGYWLLTGSPHRTKAVFTGHAWAFNESWRPKWQKALIKLFAWLTILLSDKTISVSKSAADQVSSWPFVGDRVDVIRNGITPFELLSREAARTELVLSNDSLVVGSISELHKVKGLDVLLESWKKLVEHVPAAKLVIFGEGEERAALEEEIGALELSGSVELKGFVPDARRYLKALDIFVLPSRSENLPYAVIEAGFAGLPVIASSVGGVPEIIESGTSGILVEREDPEALFSSLLLLSNDEKLRARLGESLKRAVDEQFTAEKMADDTIELYGGC